MGPLVGASSMSDTSPAALGVGVAPNAGEAAGERSSSASAPVVDDEVERPLSEGCPFGKPSVPLVDSGCSSFRLPCFLVFLGSLESTALLSEVPVLAPESNLANSLLSMPSSPASSLSTFSSELISMAELCASWLGCFLSPFRFFTRSLLLCRLEVEDTSATSLLTWSDAP